MSVNGAIKFFEPSLNLFKDGADATANSNAAEAPLILNYDKDTGWVSSGSSEGVAATITITLPENITFNRMFLLNHNFKAFTVTYGSGATAFASVVTVNNGSKANITETVYAYDTSYYEFTAVTTDQINISCSNVQAPLETVEKFLACLICCNETGTFSIAGMVKIDPSMNANNRVAKNFNNKSIIQRGIDSFSCNLSAPYLADQNDIDLMTSLFDRNEDFLVWLCGGRVGSPYFRVNHKPFRLLDLFRMRNIAALDNSYYKNIYVTGLINSLSLTEVEG